jgi:carbamoyl-phosphate synthase large subunit
MGVDQNVGLAFMKGQLAAGHRLPEKGTVFISVNDVDKEKALFPASIFQEIGFRILATKGTSEFLEQRGIQTEVINKVYEGRPNPIDLIKNKEIDLVINTYSGKKTARDSSSLRRTTLFYNIPYTTTIAGARAMAQAIKELRGKGLEVRSLQEYYSSLEDVQTPQQGGNDAAIASM